MQSKTLFNVVKNSVNSVPLNLGLLGKPKYLWFETTDRCNSRCSTCNIWQKEPTPTINRLTPSELSNCLSNPLMSNIQYVLNSGGEATLSELSTLLTVEHTALPNATLQISSNALLPKRLATAIRDAMSIGVKRLDVGLSIDGVGAAHDMVRGVPGNFAKLEESLRLIHELQCKWPNRIFLSMGSTLTDVTAKHAKELYDYCKANNANFMWHWFNTSSFYENGFSELSNDAKQVVFDYPAKNLYMDAWRTSLKNGIIPKFTCRALTTFMVIKCNGDVVPCLSRWAEPIGNIKKESIDKIWYSYLATKERKKVANCEGCLNSWGWGWSVNETYYPVIIDLIKRKAGLK